MNIYFHIYNSDGLTLSITLPHVQFTNIPQSSKKYIEHKGFRGNNSIVIIGSNDSWNGVIQGAIQSTDYANLISQIDNLESKIVFGTPYVLKIDKVEGGASSYTYNIKRVQPIEYAAGNRDGRIQKYTLNLLMNAW